MVSKKQYQAYAAAMQTVAGTRQIVMLYDGVIRYLQLAREAMTEKRIEDRYNNLTRASEIVFGLQSCLDFEQGGEVAKVLYSFYSSIDTRIFGLHRNAELSACEQLIDEIRQMRDVWDEIDRSNAGNATGQPPASEESQPSLPPAGDPTNVALSA